MKSIKEIIIIIVGVILVIAVGIGVYTSNQEIVSIKNDKDLLSAYNNYYSSDEMSLLEQILFLPYSALIPTRSRYYYENQWNAISTVDEGARNDSIVESAGSSKDYSKTNIQVEGVDEADIIKTDGDYIYSMSEDEVLITNVKDPEKPQVEARIQEGSTTPTDLILYNDKLVIISSKGSTNSRSNWYYSDNTNTVVTIYNISDKKNPKLFKSLELHEPYNTTRCIDGKLYVFSKGYLREKNEIVDRKYKIDSKTKEIPFNKIKYIKNEKNNVQTLIAEVDLNNLDKEIDVSSYLIDLSEAYVSKENIYILKNGYSYEEVEIKDLFTLKGVFGIFKDDYNYDSTTKIYKFEMNKNGVKFIKNSEVEGKIANQYSLDEKDNNLRMALETEDGTQVVILDKSLNKIGETEKVAEGEKMYASRFIGNKAYLVTYQNTDPLFVIDLSDPKNPEVLGELKIPGYSTYLHPYDENHLIGIGMNTKEVVYRDLNGRVTSRWTETTGMKMALFDVSDVNNPKEIDSKVIGDRRTVSAVLNNPKALLFSKEKNLLAIPVNNYSKDFSVRSTDRYDTSINNYNNYNSSYLSEGYLVYNVDLKGFTQKGIITHDKTTSKYSYSYNTKLLRGLYIEDDLYTVSEDYIKVNKIEDLSEKSSLKLKGEEIDEERE